MAKHFKWGGTLWFVNVLLNKHNLLYYVYHTNLEQCIKKNILIGTDVDDGIVHRWNNN